MASALSLLRQGAKVSDLGHGLAGWTLNGGVAFGGGYALGQVYHRYGDTKLGQHAPRIAAVVGKLGALALRVTTGGGILSGAVDTIGDVGLSAMGLEMGLAHARKATGKQPVLLPKGAALPAGALPITRLGELPPGQSGKTLTYDQIREFASSR